MSKIFRNIAMSKFYIKSGKLRPYIAFRAFFAPKCYVTICGSLPRVIVVMAIRALLVGLRQRVAGCRLFFACKSKKNQE